jgi:hypothetical protein
MISRNRVTILHTKKFCVYVVHIGSKIQRVEELPSQNERIRLRCFALISMTYQQMIRELDPESPEGWNDLNGVERPERERRHVNLTTDRQNFCETELLSASCGDR